MSPVEQVRAGDVLQLERLPVEPDPLTEYTAIGVRSFGRGLFQYPPASGDELGSLRFFELQPARLVISNIKAWEGAVALSSSADEGCIASNRFLIYRSADERLDVRWARWFFLSEQGIELLQRASPGSADRNRTLAVKRFEDLVIPLPSLEDQLESVAKLDRTALAAQQARELASRSKLLEDAFTAACAARPDVSDREKEQDGWVLTALADVMERTEDAVAVDPGAIYPNFGIYSFGRGLFKKPPIAGSDTSAKTLFRVRTGEFIYSRLFAFEGAYTYVPDEFDGFFVSNEFPSFQVDPDRVHVRWLASYLRDPARWADLAASSIGLGVRRQRVPVEAVLEYKVWLPPLELQHDMVRAIDRIASVRAIRSVAETRVDALVPAALNQEFSWLS